MSSGIKCLPNGLHVKWVSFAENCVYEIDTPLDYDRILALFKKGYYDPSTDPSRPEPFKREYYKINVGFAPGGVVVVWVNGGSRQIEVGRYQGYKIIISKEEIAKIEPSDQLMFTEEERLRVMSDVRIIPQEVQDAHKGKPIPFGRWDSIRKRYNWKIRLELPSHIIDTEASIFYYNGEMENLFGKFHTDKFEVEDILKMETLCNRAVPDVIRLRWFDSNNVPKTCNMTMNEKEVFQAFKEVFRSNPEGEAVLNIRINEIETNAALWLKGNGKEVWLPNTNVKVYK